MASKIQNRFVTLIIIFLLGLSFIGCGTAEAQGQKKAPMGLIPLIRIQCRKAATNNGAAFLVSTKHF